MKSYEIITPVQFDPAKPAKKSGIIQLEAEVGDEMVKIGALRALGDKLDDEDSDKPVDLSKLNLAALTALAVEAQITLPEKATRAQIIELLDAQRVEAETKAADETAAN